MKYRRKSKVVNPPIFEAITPGAARTANEERSTYKSMDDMPGPQPDLPLIGTSWVFSPFGPYSKDQALTTAREDFLSKYGPIYREKMGGATIVSLHDPAQIELVMRLQGKYPIRVVNDVNVYWRKSRPDLYNSIGLGDSNGEEWHDVRGKSAPALLKPQLLTPFAEMFSLLADNFLQVLKSEGSRNVGGALESEGSLKIPDVLPLLYRFTIESIWKATLGFELGTLQLNPSGEAAELVPHSIEIFNAFASQAISRHWWKIWPAAARVFPSSVFNKFCTAEETLFRIVSRHSQRVMKEIAAESESEAVGKPSILRRFMTVDNFNPKDINTVIVDLIVAGIPTTSFFISFLLHRLGQEKEVQARLQQELDRVLGGKDVITNDLLLSLPYLKAVMKEGLRLTTIIPGIMRLLPVDITCDQYLIPAHTPIVCQTRAATRSPKYFSSPEEFIPERFLPSADSAEMKQLQKEAYDNRFLMIPFGFGPRMCVGKRLAEKEILVLLAKIFLKFDVRSTGELELSNRFVIGPKSSVPIEFISRT